MTDWCVGDLAVCVDASPCRCGCRGKIILVEGAPYRVEGIVVEDCMTKLCLADIHACPSHPGPGASANRFRKIRPDTHEACEAEFVTLLKRTKRKVEA